MGLRQHLKKNWSHNAERRGCRGIPQDRAKNPIRRFDSFRFLPLRARLADLKVVETKLSVW